jgi:hypothetical protein
MCWLTIPSSISSNTNLRSFFVCPGKSKLQRATNLGKTYSDQLLNNLLKYGVMEVERDDLLEDLCALIEDLWTLCETVGITPLKMQVR